MLVSVILMFAGVPDIVKIIGYVAGIITALLYAYHRIAKTVATIRDHARLAEKERNDETQNKITAAVEAERQRWLDHKEDETERIARLKDIAQEWRNIAEQKDIRNRLQEEELRKVQDELAELRKLYIESQTRILALEEMVKAVNPHG